LDPRLTRGMVLFSCGAFRKRYRKNSIQNEETNAARPLAETHE
jgi:hypothetical protein